MSRDKRYIDTCGLLHTQALEQIDKEKEQGKTVKEMAKELRKLLLVETIQALKNNNQ